jgi:predicted metal-dependent peptidase
MGGFYPILFGEVAGICQLAKPESVLMLWWDTRVAGVQKFTPDQYENIKQAMCPAGGGGTEPSVVYDYLRVHNKKPQCIVFITDGYIGDEPFNTAGCPVLWCVIGNRGFVPRQGKAVYIDV